MAFNKNELLLDKVRSATTHDLSTGELLMRLTSLEEPTLSVSAEGEEVTDAVGALITTMYRAKRAEFSASNSLISIDLMAAQYGTKKEVASADNKIIASTYQVLTIVEGETTVTLAHTPKNEISYIYSIDGGEIATSFKSAAAASETEFVVGEDGVITVPTGFTGKLYIEYDFETEDAVRVVNSSENFPEACLLKIYAYFRDKCNENLVYSGVIVCPKAKLSPESSELSLTSTGKHPFTFQMMKDYCTETAELFSVIIFGGQE